MNNTPFIKIQHHYDRFFQANYKWYWAITMLPRKYFISSTPLAIDKKTFLLEWVKGKDYAAIKAFMDSKHAENLGCNFSLHSEALQEEYYNLMFFPVIIDNAPFADTIPA